jgi:cytidyltransferase-like protein
MDGLLLGRFQPFHLGHLEFMTAAKARCSRLYIGITNPDSSSLQYSEFDPKRSEASNNPFTYFDRARMIEETAGSLGWTMADFMVVPAPISDLARLKSYLPHPASTVYLATIYDEWGEEKIRRLASLGYATEVMWRRTYAQRFTTGAEVRRRLREHGDWRPLVPDAVASYMTLMGFAP